jgi:hypothetical protein
MDRSGGVYVAGTLASTEPVNVQTRPAPAPAVPLRSDGDADVFVARYDPAGQLVWARAIGDDDPSAPGKRVHVATGAAVTGDGTIGVVGKLVGEVTFGRDTLSGASPVSYLAALSATGDRLWAKQVNLGSFGSFRTIAANPRSAQSRFAVCGSTSRAAKELVDSAVHGGLSDLLLAVFDSKGNRVWSVQLGGKETEGCHAVAIDDAGDVYAAGWFDGPSLTFPGAPPLTVPGPGTAMRKSIWVAKFAGGGDGAGGAKVLKAVSYGGTFGAAAVNALALGRDGSVLLGGQFTGDLAVGAPIASVGQDDGFVAKLDGKTLAPAWGAVRIGGDGLDQVRGVSELPGGDVLAVGMFSGASPQFRAGHGGKDTDGAAALASGGGEDGFVLRLAGKTGATVEARSYGGQLNQSLDGVAAGGAAGAPVALVGALNGTADFGAAGTLDAQGRPGAFLLFGKAR